MMISIHPVPPYPGIPDFERREAEYRKAVAAWERDQAIAMVFVMSSIGVLFFGILGGFVYFFSVGIRLECL